MVQVIEHGRFQRSNCGVASTANASFRHFGKQSFHKVQPTGARRSEVDVIAGVACQPLSHFAHLVRTVVVHDQVNVKATREILLDLIEKTQELLMAVASVAIADGDAACHVHGREQRGNSMPFVIMRLSRRDTWGQRQNRLRTVQRLHLALFVYT